ncbi:MAG: sensor histidine kinase [Deltaproteobacteria bacterium]
MTAGSLKLRLLVGASAFILCAMMIAAVALSYLFDRHVKEWIDLELSAHVDQLISGIDQSPDGRLVIARPPADPRFNRPLSGLYWQAAFETSGDVVRSRSLWDTVISIPAAAGIDGHAHHHRVAGPSGQTLYVLEKRVELPARLGRERVRIAAAVDEAEVDKAVLGFATSLTPFLLLLAVLLAAAAWIQVLIGLKPLASIREHISAIRSGRAKRLGNDYPEEVQPLTREIDTLLDARDRQIETARARAADLAHGLKTPLQVLVGTAEKLRSKGENELAADLVTATGAMQRHVDRQLARARMQAGGTAVATAARAVAERVANVVRKTPDGAARSWRIDVPENLRVIIHPDDLAEAIGSLVENAARHARSRVVISSRCEADWIALCIADDGPGIPHEHQSDVLARGRRLDVTRPGTGLGLAIASDIAEAWDGSIDFEREGEFFNAVLRLRPA